MGQGVALLVGRRADKPLLEHVPEDGFRLLLSQTEIAHDFVDG